MIMEEKQTAHQYQKKEGELPLDVYKCQHGGPGEVTSVNKQMFVVNYSANREKARKQQGWAQLPEIVAAELVVLEECITKNEEMKKLVDQSLMRLYFGMAVDALLKAQPEQARINARIGTFLAMYLQHGDAFWPLTNADPETQKTKLRDMHLSLGKMSSDAGLAELLNVQTPCTCLEQAFPALKEKMNRWST